MVMELMDAISKKLRDTFQGAFPIYADAPVFQGLEEPCFFVSLTEANRASLPSGRQRVRIPFDIAFFPRERECYAEMWDMGETLFDVMETVTLADGSSVRGLGRRQFIAEGVSHFIVTFAVNLLPGADEGSSGEMMGDLKVSVLPE